MVMFVNSWLHNLKFSWNLIWNLSLNLRKFKMSLKLLESEGSLNNATYMHLFDVMLQGPKCFKIYVTGPGKTGLIYT